MPWDPGVPRVERQFSPTAILLLWGLSMAAPGAAPARADEISVAMGDHLPPYIIPEAATGFEVEVFREALAHAGHSMKPIFVPIKRVAMLFAEGKYDVAMMDSGLDLESSGGLYGEPAAIYDNVFIALADRHLSIKSPDDLRGLSVLCFPGALARYPDWLSGVARAGKYRETNNQTLQALMLQAGEADVVLSDRYVFRYFAHMLRKKKGRLLSEAAEYSVLTEDPRNYRTIFRDGRIRSDFESGLRFLKESGRFSELFSKFVGCVPQDANASGRFCLGMKWIDDTKPASAR